MISGISVKLSQMIRWTVILEHMEETSGICVDTHVHMHLFSEGPVGIGRDTKASLELG